MTESSLVSIPKIWFSILRFLSLPNWSWSLNTRRACGTSFPMSFIAKFAVGWQFATSRLLRSISQQALWMLCRSTWKRPSPSWMSTSQAWRMSPTSLIGEHLVSGLQLQTFLPHLPVLKKQRQRLRWTLTTSCQSTQGALVALMLSGRLQMLLSAIKFGHDLTFHIFQLLQIDLFFDSLSQWIPFYISFGLLTYWGTGWVGQASYLYFYGWLRQWLARSRESFWMTTSWHSWLLGAKARSPWFSCALRLWILSRSLIWSRPFRNPREWSLWKIVLTPLPGFAVLSATSSIAAVHTQPLSKTSCGSPTILAHWSLRSQSETPWRRQTGGNSNWLR